MGGAEKSVPGTSYHRALIFYVASHKIFENNKQNITKTNG